MHGLRRSQPRRHRASARPLRGGGAPQARSRAGTGPSAIGERWISASQKIRDQDRARLLMWSASMTKAKHDRLLVALLTKLPTAMAPWPRADRIAWLQMTAMAFDVIYGPCGGVRVIAGEACDGKSIKQRPLNIRGLKLRPQARHDGFMWIVMVLPWETGSRSPWRSCRQVRSSGTNAPARNVAMSPPSCGAMSVRHGEACHRT